MPDSPPNDPTEPDFEYSVKLFVTETDDGQKLVGLTLPGMPLGEYNGEIVTGLGLTPVAARDLAAKLIDQAEQIESGQLR
jgi:hypothetical protein